MQTRERWVALQCCGVIAGERGGPSRNTPGLPKSGTRSRDLSNVVCGWSEWMLRNRRSTIAAVRLGGQFETKQVGTRFD